MQILELSRDKQVADSECGAGVFQRGLVNSHEDRSQCHQYKSARASCRSYSCR